MKILHVVSGGEVGGSRKHIVTLLAKFPKDEVTLLVFQEGKLLEEARASGIHVHIFKQKSRYDLSVLQQYANFINIGGYDIIHTHGARANFFTYLIKRHIHARWITTIHSDPRLDFMNGNIKGKIFTRLHLHAIKKVDVFFAVSTEFKKNLIKLGIPEQKITTIYNGIEYNMPVTASTELKECLGILPEDFVVIHVARLHPIKGHITLFEAIHHLDIKELKVLLVGDGPLEEELMNQAKAMNVHKKITFLGFREDVDYLLSLADINVLTSYSESFPLVLLEGAAQQIPCIATDVGGISEFICDQSIGWVIPPRDAVMLSNALQEAYLYKKNGELQRKGKNIYERATSSYSLDNLYQQICLAYKNISL